MSEVFQALREHSQEKRKINREKGAQILQEHGIPFEEKNGGAHLIIQVGGLIIDYWPGTGRWVVRHGMKGFGVRSLLKYIEELTDEGPGEPRLKLKPQPEIEEEEEEEGPSPR